MPNPSADTPPDNATPPRLWRIATLAWAGVIFWGSSLPGSQVPGKFGSLGHLLEYVVLSALLYASLRRDVPSRNRVFIAIALASVFGVTDEIHQIFVPQRVPDPTDWVVDTIGSTIGALTAWKLVRTVNDRTPAQ